MGDGSRQPYLGGKTGAQGGEKRLITDEHIELLVAGVEEVVGLLAALRAGLSVEVVLVEGLV